jgi:hypothetical protein
MRMLTGLHQGDEVFWNDPDEGICSGHGTFIEYHSDEVAWIEKDGLAIEVYVHELA